MNFSKTFLIFVLVIAFASVSGACSKGSSNPVVGDFVDGNILSEMQAGQPPELGDLKGIGMLGAYSLDISPDYSSAELVPVRGPSLGESFIVSGVAYFWTQPCRDCLRISSVGLDVDENIVLGFTVSHPFEKGDTGQPPSGRNRLDLDIFDVELLVSSTDAPTISFPMMNADIPSGLILNPDGYSNDLGMILPFKNCYESSNNNRFEMGTKNHEFEVSFPKLGLLSYELYLTFGYGESATIETRFDPVYYVPEFNRKSAWKIEVDDAVWNDDNPSDVVIRVYDWNHGATIADEYPNPDNTKEILASSDVAYVFVEVPGMTNYLAGAALTDGLTNGYDIPLIYTASFKNDKRLAVGDYTGLVCVIDSRSEIVSGPGGTLIQTEDGKILNLSELPNYASYQTFKATIESISTDCGPISGEIISPECPVMDLEDGSTIDFVVSASSDNGGIPVTEYEIDIDFDGITFDIDATSPDGSFPGMGPFENPNRNGSVTNYTIAFRATDSCVPSNKQIFETCQVTVGINFNPIDVTPPWLSFLPQDIQIEGNYAYTIGYGRGIHVFDISNPLNPVWVNWIEMSESIDDISVSGDYAYLAVNYTGLVIMNINPPESAYIVNTIDTLEQAEHVEVSGGYAYVVDYGRYTEDEYNSNYGFEIIDIDPPESAYIVKTVYTPGNAVAVDVSGGYAYVADGAYGLQIFDIEPPEAAHIVKTVDTVDDAYLDGAYRVQVSHGYAYVAIYDYGFDYQIEHGLQIFDIDPPESAHVVNSVDLTERAWVIYLSGGYAYLANDRSGLQIIDIESPESAYILKTVDTPGRAEGVCVSGGYAYVVDSIFGIQVIDIDPVESADIVKTVLNLSSVNGVKVSDGYAYVADRNIGLQIIDVSLPESAHIVNTVHTPGDAANVDISGGYAYLVDDDWSPPHIDHALQIIDINPPESAYIVNSVATPDRPWDVHISDGYAYVTVRDAGLVIIDINPPELAYIVKTVDTPGSAGGVYVSGSYAYVTNSDNDSQINNGLQIIDINPPESAHIVETFYTSGYARDVWVSDGYAYIGGFRIVDLW